MAIPALTPAQRSEGLRKAFEARQARAELRNRLRANEIGIAQVFDAAHHGDRVAARISVRQMLTALPGIGNARAGRLMQSAGIAANRRVGGLGPRQREVLLEYLG